MEKLSLKSQDIRTINDLQKIPIMEETPRKLESQFSLPPLVIKRVDRIDRSSSDKFQYFTSDFF